MAPARDGHRSVRSALAMLLLGLLLVLTACTSPHGPHGADPSGPAAGAEDDTGTSAAEPVTIAVVGDSITVGSDGTFAPGQVSEDSWVRYAVGDPIELAGGWARWGATTAEMAAAATPVPAEVLVVMAGTNDLAAGVPTAQVSANLEQIVATVGAEQVLLCGVPPLDARPELVPPFNEFLQRTAQEHGWAWADPAAAVRTGGSFVPGMSVDGVHPTQAGATQIGARVRTAILDHVGGTGGG